MPWETVQVFSSLVGLTCTSSVGTCSVNCALSISGEGFLKTFFDKTKNMTPEERGKYLEEDEVYMHICMCSYAA